ncbi:hypothetical protein L1787_03405 [Acuticoccus sp. M5D2P5]|uniref:hypothetical protein n=1 Tax=Acuticoccus kalidii TaxID=2910977 RepID=UPI001F3B299A|nr:hypothetical protein [Acuticoccus kalidii]MCF3932461.1 hypothetical protein [Acuticoccus kalidii]
MNSLTNVSITAAQPLSAINTDLMINRVSPGQRPGETRTNTSYWTIPGSAQAEMTTLHSVHDALVRGSVRMEVAAATLGAARTDLSKIRDILASAQVRGTDRAAAQSAIAAKLGDLRAILATGRGIQGPAIEGGRRDTAAPVTAGLEATREIVSKIRTAGSTASAVDRIDISALTDSVADLTTLAEYLGIVDAALVDIITQSDLVTTMVARAKSQGAFIAALIDATRFPEPSLIEKNLENTAAVLLAIQAQEQLSTAQRPIANGSSGSGEAAMGGGTVATTTAPTSGGMGASGEPVTGG